MEAAASLDLRGCFRVGDSRARHSSRFARSRSSIDWRLARTQTRKDESRSSRPSKIRSVNFGVFSKRGWARNSSAWSKDLQQVDRDVLGLERDGELAGAQPVEACPREGIAHIVQDLAQRGARLDFLGLAPKEADDPFAALLARLRKGRDRRAQRPALRVLSLTSLPPQLAEKGPMIEIDRVCASAARARGARRFVADTASRPPRLVGWESVFERSIGRFTWK